MYCVSVFFEQRINPIFDGSCQYTCKINDDLPIVAFSGPPSIRHYLAYQIVSKFA
jgi:hypothetical protein